MALTDFEKVCLLECQNHLNGAVGRGRPTDQETADLETIATGTEVERRAIVVTYVTDISTPRTDASLTALGAEKVRLDAEKVRLDALKIELAAYIA